MSYQVERPNVYLRIAVTMLVLGILAGPVQAQSGEPPQQLMVHVVERGETLFSIAQQYGVTVDAITHANAVSDPRKVYVGQRLIIPRGPASIGPAETAPYILQAGDTLASIAQRYGTTWHALAQLNDLLVPNAVVSGQVIKVPVSHKPSDETGAPKVGGSPVQSGATYVVREDDTWFRIALRYDVPPWTLANANRITNPALIYTGQELVAPGAGRSMLPQPFRAVQIRPLPVAQGTTMVVSVQTTEPVTLTGRLFEQPVRFGEEGGVYYGFVGVHVLTDPGLYDLELTAVDADANSTVINTGVVVEPARFYYERIDVPYDRTNLLDPAAIARDRERLGAARTTFSSERRWTLPFQRPSVGSISAYFGSLRSYNGGPYTSFHSGVDLRAPRGTPVYAPAAGTVILAEGLAQWGNAVVIDHGWGVLSGFAHLSAIEVEVGQELNQGDLVAKVGNTGLSVGSHLHWEMWVGGTSVNAMQWLEESFPWQESEWMGIGG